MRNPERIDKFCNELAKIWKEPQCRDWRFSQLVINVFDKIKSEGCDPWFVEEDKMMNYIQEYFKI